MKSVRFPLLFLVVIIGLGGTVTSAQAEHILTAISIPTNVATSDGLYANFVKVI